MVEAADTGPFFHNNSVDTIEGAVAFYNGDAFNNSPAGQLIIGATGSGINLESTQVVAVAAFLRVINALENIRASGELLDRAYRVSLTGDRQSTLLERASFEIDDGIAVLAAANLHPVATQHLVEALALVRSSLDSDGSSRRQLVDDARAQLALARDRMVES